ncbi:MAG: hypothetical protein HY710_11160 [Candidatus Latescibacteria bacterium]|nr:hypothetical protein [Candidatus Latescibacterota bacterium]
MTSPFTHPWLLIGALIAVAALYVVLPVVMQAFWRYRRPRTFVCPDTGGQVEIHLDAAHAAVGAAYDQHPHLRVKQCALWPDRRNCEQACLKQA